MEERPSTSQSRDATIAKNRCDGQLDPKELAARIIVFAEEREKLQDSIAKQNKRVKELNAIMADMENRTS